MEANSVCEHPVFAAPYYIRQLDIASKPEGKLPLHLACECGHINVVKRLLLLGTDMSKLDHNSQNAVHYAAMSPNPDIIFELCKSPSYSLCLNAKNGCGLSPLFLAIRNKKSGCVKNLLKSGAAADEPCNGRLALQEAIACGAEEGSLRCTSTLVAHCPRLVVQKNPSTGDTPLHTISNGQILDALLACSEILNINEKNGRGQTALHIFVVKDLIHCVLKFLAHGGDPNISDKDGNTPLHLAAKGGRLDITKALLLFGANGKLKNSADRTAVQMASLDKSLGSEIQYCIQIKLEGQGLPESSLPQDSSALLEDFAQALSLSSVVKSRESSVGHKINLLSLDGGGIRGLILIQILLHLESHLGSSIVDKFKWIGGTSTGAILGIALSLGKSLRECQALYFRFKDAVFKGIRPYDTNILENFLKKEIGVDKTMADIQSSRRLTVTTVLADKQPVTLVLFRNYRLPISDDENSSVGYISPKEQILWKAARCSSAAPTYFSKVDGKYVDGGLIANNPTLDLLTEADNHNLAAKYVGKPEETIELGCVLSVGTGQTPSKPINADSFDLGLPKNALDAFVKAVAVKDLGNLLIDQVTAAEGRPVDRSRAWCNSMGIPYFRFSTPFTTDVPLDATDDILLIKVLWETELYMLRGAIQKFLA